MNKIVSKNILFLQQSIALVDGGVPRVSYIISKELTRRGHNCYFIHYGQDEENYSTEVKLKVNLKRTYQEIENLILQFVKKNEIDIFICQNAYSALFIKIYKRIRSVYPFCPFICFLHASPDYWKADKFQTNLFDHNFLFFTAKRFLKKIVFLFYNPYIISTSSLYDLCNKFILLSDSFKNPYLQIYSIRNANKLLVIPNPLTFDDFLLPGQLIKKEKIVLIVSRLVESQKKISLALKVWHHLSKKNKDNWQLVIVGSGVDEDLYKSFVRIKKVQNVIFAGQKSDVLPYYQQASIFLMTSIWEGLPMALLEAQQNGVVPIVFNNFSAVYDVISDGENGFVINNNDITEFSEKLFDLMQNEKMRNKMALKSIENSRQFHVSNIADQWEEIIKEQI